MSYFRSSNKLEHWDAVIVTTTPFAATLDFNKYAAFPSTPAADIYINLPTAVGNDGKVFEFIHADINASGSDDLFVQPQAGEQIGSGSPGAAFQINYGFSLKIVSNGAHWNIL